MSLVAEQWVGDWRLLEPLGQGGFAEVWRAQHSDGRLAALKVPSDPRFLDHLRRERATRQGAAAHPAIVGTLEDGLEHDPPYLALELVDGPSLRQRLERGPLSPQSVLDFVRDLAAALDGAHDQGVLHLDVKPGNVLFDSDGRVRLTDFGAGRAAVSDAELRQSLDFSRDLSRTGTPDYAAPELRFPAGAVDRRADVYSLAVVTYEALTGRPPLGLDRPSELRPELPQAVDPVLAKGLAQDPTRRPLSAGAFAGELAVALAESLAGEPGASGPTLAPAAPPARRSWSAGAARWLLLLALAALPLLALSSNEPDPLYQACAPLRAQLNAQGPAGGPVAVVLPPIDLGAAPGLAKVLRQRLPGALGLDDADALEWAPDDLEPEALWTPLGRQALGERGARQALYLVLPEGAERAEDARLFLARINPGLELIASSDWPRDRAAERLAADLRDRLDRLGDQRPRRLALLPTREVLTVGEDAWGFNVGEDAWESGGPDTHRFDADLLASLLRQPLPAVWLAPHWGLDPSMSLEGFGWTGPKLAERLSAELAVRSTLARAASQVEVELLELETGDPLGEPAISEWQPR